MRVQRRGGSFELTAALAHDIDDFQPDVVVLQTALRYEHLAAEPAEIAGDGHAEGGRRPAFVIVAEGPRAAEFARAFGAGISML